MDEATLTNLKEFLGTYADPEQLVITLGITSEDILEAFEEQLIDNSYKFKEEIDNI